MRRQRPKEQRLIAATLKEQEITAWQSTKPVFSRINENRWIADCAECRGAEFVIEGQPFICASCGAVSVVTWPAETEEIEQVLDKRLNPLNRNWMPGETVDDLLRENSEHREMVR